MSTLVETLSSNHDNCFVEEWYEFASTDHFWMAWRWQALSNLLQALKLDTSAQLKVLDIGAGNGAVRSQIEASTQWIVDCVDLNLEGLKQMPEGRGRNLYYNILDKNPQMIGQYDLVLALDVIEHLPSTADFLKAATEHAKPSAPLVINVPALQSMYSQYDKHVGHYRRYNKKSLRQALQQAGLDAGVARYWGLSLVPVLAARKAWLAGKPTDSTTVNRGFHPPARWINTALKAIGYCETRLLSAPPVGSSLLMATHHRSSSVKACLATGSKTNTP